MKLSNRILDMQASPVRKLVPLAQKVKANGTNVLHLNIGDPDIKTPDIFWNAIKEFNEPILSYAFSEGDHTLLEAISKYYKQFNLNYTKEDIVITNGGSEALILALTAVCDHGDDVIVFEPFYTNYNGFASSTGVNVVAIPTDSKNGFHLPDKEVILSKITPKTKAILFSNPGNPTGTVYTKDELNMLAEIAKEKGLFIISDEVYREFVYDGLEFTSAGTLQEVINQVIIIDSISKRYSACGARVGSIASKNKELMENVLKLCQSRLCVATLDQVGAAALYDADQIFLQDVIKEYDHRRNVIYDALNDKEGIFFQKPTGAFYIVVDLPVVNAEHFIIWLLTEFSIDNETVMMAPAQGFYATPNTGLNQARIAYILDSEKLQRAAKIIIEGLKEYKKHYE